MGKVSKGAKCSIEDCSREALRSISYDKVSMMKMTVLKGRRVYLCGEHYREYKKRSKKDRRLERLRFKV